MNVGQLSRLLGGRKKLVATGGELDPARNCLCNVSIPLTAAMNGYFWAYDECCDYNLFKCEDKHVRACLKQLAEAYIDRFEQKPIDNRPENPV